jgi:hypothetical protein
VKLKRKVLLRNRRSLHPIRDRAQEEKTDKLLREYQLRMIRDRSAPRWFGPLLVIGLLVAAVWGYIDGKKEAPQPHYEPNSTYS